MTMSPSFRVSPGLVSTFTFPFFSRTFGEGDINKGTVDFVKAIGWARKYGLRINLDLHAVPGSQKYVLPPPHTKLNRPKNFISGWNHSGRVGPINFLNGVNGIVNAQRTLNIIRTLAEFISRPEYSMVRSTLP